MRALLERVARQTSLARTQAFVPGLREHIGHELRHPALGTTKRDGFFRGHEWSAIKTAEESGFALIHGRALPGLAVRECDVSEGCPRGPREEGQDRGDGPPKTGNGSCRGSGAAQTSPQPNRHYPLKRKRPTPRGGGPFAQRRRAGPISFPTAGGTGVSARTQWLAAVGSSPVGRFARRTGQNINEDVATCQRASCGGDLSRFARILLPQPGSIARDGTGDGPIRATVDSSAVLGTDLCVLLEWDAQEPLPGGCDLGNSLARALRETGLVHYTVWKQEETR